MRFPQTLKVIRKDAFADSSDLKVVQLPDSVEEIGLDAFRQTGVENFVAPKSLRIIRQSAFQGCASLRHVELNEGLEVLGTNDHGRQGLGRGVHEQRARERETSEHAKENRIRNVRKL